MSSQQLPISAGNKDISPELPPSQWESDKSFITVAVLPVLIATIISKQAAASGLYMAVTAWYYLSGFI
ncbi:hypothetical protein EWN88_23240 [Salmonella enterica]|nr:hypothetical protein [Salmonella enterica]EAC1542108.1 hypothetical protein [Salmonella enterica subsp. enterica]EAM5400256.1 hypothetical protein [Salmonella enterica]EAN8864766.1 hypothetical protein [Salmonella enterica]EAQ6980191.1 hypothetical protein [Salmonella enterica]